jgi:hypothetical protein
LTTNNSDKEFLEWVHNLLAALPKPPYRVKSGKKGSDELFIVAASGSRLARMWNGPLKRNEAAEFFAAAPQIIEDLLNIIDQTRVGK